MPGFEIHKIGDSVSSVSFHCPTCDSRMSNLSKSDIDYDGTHKGFTKTCCCRFKASQEVLYALEAIDASMKRIAAENKLSETKSSIYTYIVFGLLPLIFGVIFGNSGAIGLGMMTTVIAVVIWYYSNR